MSSPSSFLSSKSRILVSVMIMAVLILSFFTASVVRGETVVWTQTENPSSGPDGANAVVVDSTGVYIAGSDSIPGYAQWRFEKRSLIDGSLLWAGTESVPGAPSIPYGAALDGTGFYIVGYDRAPGNDEWKILKVRLTDGSVLWRQTEDACPGWNMHANGVAVDKTGLYIVGYDGCISYDEWRIEKRSLTDGSLISSFGASGVVTENLIGGADASKVAVDSSGIYVVGFDSISGSAEWRIEKRSLTDGSLLNAFGNLGRVREDISPGDDEATSVAVNVTGIYISGYDNSPGGSQNQWRIEKRDLNSGASIWTQIEHPSSTGNDRAYGITLDATGVYVVGYDNSLGGSDYEWRFEKRDLNSGALIWSITENPSPNFNSVRDVAVDKTGLYAVGSDQVLGPSNDELRIEKRQLGVATTTTSSSTSTSTTSTGPFGDFGIALSPTSVTVAQGSSVSTNTTISSLAGFSSGVALSALGVPSGLTVSFATNPITPLSAASVSSVTTIAATSSLGTGSYVITIQGASGSLSHSTSLTVHVTSAASFPDFSLTSSPPNITMVQGEIGTSKITVGSLNGFNSAVSLTYSWVGSAPSGVTVSLPGPVNPSGPSASSSLTVGTSSSSSTGSFILVVTGTSGSLGHNINVGVTITSASATTSTTAPPTGPTCLIATAAYGSELAPEVQLLRSFRDDLIIKTNAGSNFMIVFNDWYYSFSPAVASYLSGHWFERTIMKGALYPLIGVMYLTSHLFSLARPYPELAVVISGLFASTFIGAFYLGLPIALIRSRIRRLGAARTQKSVQRLLGVILLGALGSLLIGEIAGSPSLLMFSTSAIVLATIFLSAIFTSFEISKRLVS